jgi:drug/metabolite transporter (DMT)-like permease
MITRQPNVRQALDPAAMVMLAVLCASWGLQQVAIKVANQGIAPVLQSGLRSIGAAVLIWLWMVVRRQPLLARDGTWWWGMAAGLLFAGEFLLVYWGLEFTNASRAVVFLYTAPFVVALGAKVFIPGERLGLAHVMGLGFAFAGILIAFGESLSLPSQPMLIGDAMLAGAAIFWGAATVVVKASPLAGISAAKTLLYQLAVSALALPLGSLAMGESWRLRWTPLIAASLVYQTVWVATITYLVWFWLVRRYPASRLAAFTFLTPLFGVMAGGLLLDEPITGWLVMALVLVASGIYLVNRPAPAAAARQFANNPAIPTVQPETLPGEK